MFFCPDLTKPFQSITPFIATECSIFFGELRPLERQAPNPIYCAQAWHSFCTGCSQAKLPHKTPRRAARQPIAHFLTSASRPVRPTRARPATHGLENAPPNHTSPCSRAATGAPALKLHFPTGD